jgi:ethanolamine utilization protein EutN
MYLGKVIGTVVSTSKAESLVGAKMLIVKKIDENYNEMKMTEIAVDSVGAGVGEIVLISKGSSARSVFEKRNIPVDACIVGIVDSVEIND